MHAAHFDALATNAYAHLVENREVRRKPLRLREYDYSSCGPYFATACTHGRACLLGEVVDDTVVLTSIGQAARNCLVAIPEHHRGSAVDAYVVMPNHVHMVVVIDDSQRTALGTIVGTFKAAVARSVKRPGLWQRGYYEHVVRDEVDLERIREYVATNPARWSSDPENPAGLAV